MVRNICCGKVRFNLCKIPMTLASFIDILVMWASQVTFWSTVMSKELNSSTCSIISLLIVNISLGERLGDLKNNISLDFATFKTSILLTSQDEILEISQLIAYSNSTTLLSVLKISRVETNVVSSAYKIKSNFDDALIISLMKMFNNKVPKLSSVGYHIKQYGGLILHYPIERIDFC